MATENDPLTTSPAELAISIVSMLTIAFCVFAAAQILRGRWTAPQGFALIVMAILLPIVGPALGYWLMLRARARTPAPVH